MPNTPPVVGTPGTIRIDEAMNVLTPRNSGGVLTQGRFVKALAATALRVRTNNQDIAIDGSLPLPTMVFNLNTTTVTGIPPITIIGGTPKDIELATRLLSAVAGNERFRNYLKSIGVGLPDKTGKLSPNTGIYVLIGTIVDIAGGIGGQGQSDAPYRNSVGQFVPTSNQDGQYETFVQSTEDSSDGFKQFTFIKNLVHELFHFNNRHAEFPALGAPNSAADLTTLLGFTDSQIRTAALNDTTYVESNKVVFEILKNNYKLYGFDSEEQLQLNLDPKATSGDVAKFYIQRRLDILVWTYDLILAGTLAFALTPVQSQSALATMVSSGIIKLNKNGNPANPADYTVDPSARGHADLAATNLSAANSSLENAIARLEEELGPTGPPQDEDNGDETASVDVRLKKINNLYADLLAKRAREQAGQIGQIFGSTIGRHIAGGNIFAQIGVGTVLGTITENIAEIIKVGGIIQKLPSGRTQSVLADFDQELFANLKSAGIGAISSFLSAELVKALGLHGFAGELANTVTGTVIGKVLNNIVANVSTKTGIFDGVDVSLIGNAVGSFLGSKLASEIVSFGTVGGQLGAAIGSAVGPLLAASLVVGVGAEAALLGLKLGAFAGPVAAFVGAFLGFIVGGLIGSIFGGTPQSGADVAWDAGIEHFKVANVYAKKGGSKNAAISIAGSVANTLNTIIDTIGGDLRNPKGIQLGNYGIYGKEFVYKPFSSQSKSSITQKFRGPNAGQALVNYGLSTALKDVDFEIRGGDLYGKRALYNYLDKTTNSNFELSTNNGYLSLASDYKIYLTSKFVIQGLIAAEPNSAFAVGWVVTLSEVSELGLDKRSRSDWFGGWNYFLSSLSVTAPQLEMKLLFDEQVQRSARYFSIFGSHDQFSGYLEDTILSKSVTQIAASVANDFIDLRTGKLADQENYTVNGHLNNDIAISGTDFTAQANAPVSFTPGTAGSTLAADLRRSVSLTITNDGLAEASEKFLGQLSNGSGVSIIGGAAEATIIDGTAAKPTLLVGRSYALEGDGFAVFRLSLSKASATAVTVSLLTAAVNATAGTGAGADYNATIQVSSDGGVTWSLATANPSATFAAGATEIYARVAVLTDNGVDVGTGKPTNVEGNERFTLTATVTAGAAAIANVADTAGVVAASGTGTIVDASVGTTPLAWIDSVVVDETGAASFSIARSRAGTAASLSFSTADRKELVIDVAATVDAGGGDDVVFASDLGDNVFGGAGDDTLYGGRLDDWLLGGDGDDVLDAGGPGASTLGANLVKTDTWPVVGDDAKGANLIDLAGWPGDPANVPGGYASVAGWVNVPVYVDETQWISGITPDGSTGVIIRSGQIDVSAEGGGNHTNSTVIDSAKGYEFTYHFQITDIGKHYVYFGLDGAPTETLSTGANDPYNYFQYYSPAEQIADAAAGKLVAGKWYKAVGYVLPKGAAAVAEASIGGIFDAATGTKIRDNKANLRWDDTVTTANVYSRFFNYYGEANQGYSTNFYKPELREINSSAYLPGGFASVAGWQNIGAFVDETRWAQVTGPNGSPIVAIQTGQKDISAEGGGNYTNEVSIDGQKAYQFIQYFKKTDLTKQYLFFGMDASGSAYVENAATGGADTNPYFLNFSPAQQQSALVADRWYKVVGYVLAQGSSLISAGSLGGIYDTVTGAKVGSTTAFRWSGSRPDNQVHARFFNYYDEAQPLGYTTYFSKPEIREVISGAAGSLGGDGNYLNGGAGNDLLIGREGSDWLEGGDGTDILEGGDGGDILAGGGGVGDVLHGGRGDDQYIFRIGDVGSVGIGDATKYDEVRDESGISLTTIVEQAFGGSTAYNAAALDGTLFRGGGAVAGIGLNNWHGSGVQVSAQGVAAGGEDALVLGTGIGIEDIKILKSADGKDLIIELWPDGVFAGDRVVMKDWFNSFNKIETLRFADGNEIRLADFDTFILGSDGNETIIGTAGNDFVQAGAGDDLVYLLSGNDFGNGGLGNDTVSGDSGNDIVVGADGDDTLYGGFGQDTVSGGRGNDRLSGDEGNDILSGGAGTDQLIGGSGDDVFRFQRGDGKDTLIDALTNEWDIVWISGLGGQINGSGTGYVVNSDGTIIHKTANVQDEILFDGQRWSETTRYVIETGTLYRHRPANQNAIVANSGNDILEFGIGIDVNDIQFKTVGNDLIIGIEGSGAVVGRFDSLADQIVLKEWASNSGAKSSIEKFAFFNTGVVDTAAFDLKGGADADETGLAGTAGRRNWITGGAGDDNITGADLADILNGNSGQDTLNGGLSDDILLGGVGNDTLVGGAGADKLIGGEGLDIAAYDTAVTVSLTTPVSNLGDAAGDVFDSVEGLRGSASDDSLEGDYGENDIRGGKGNDSLKGGGGDDLYTFGRGDGTDTILDAASGGEIVIMENGKLISPYISTVQLVDREGASYQFENIITNSETGEIIYRLEIVTGIGFGINFPAPTSFAEAGFVRNADNSARFQFTGLVGGYTSATSRTFTSVAAPGGADTILFEDYTGNAGVTGDATIALSDLSFAFGTGATANDLTITVNNSGGSVVIKNFRNGAALDANSGIETLQFSDGSSVRLGGLRFDAVGALIATPTSGDDFIITNLATPVNASAGNDTLLGGAAANNLDGGDGDDVLIGGLSGDTLSGGLGIDTANYVGSDALVNVNLSLTTAQANIANSESSLDILSGIENVIGSIFNDTITGSAGDNVLKGNRGNDIITDTLGGADVLIGDDGDDTLSGGIHEDNLDGGAGNDILDGGGDRDVLAGGDGNDILRGDGTAGTAAGGNLIVNNSFETGTGATATDLPGWANSAARAFPLITTGVTGLSATNRAIKLDDATGNITLTQKIANLTAGETLTLSFSSAAIGTGTSAGLEVRWNNQLLSLTPNTTSATFSTITVSNLVANDGENTLTFTGLGASDAASAVIDNVSLTRATGAADQLIGGAGVDRLEGGAGNDVLLGGDGDDSSATIVTGTTKGGLFGDAGDDILAGGAGNDTLDGGLGADKYLFAPNEGNDVVTMGGGLDEFIFKDIRSDQLWFQEVDNALVTANKDLIITAVGQGMSVRVLNWKLGTGVTTDLARRIVASDKALARSDVATLVTAMGGAAPPSWPSSPSTQLTDALKKWQDPATYVDRAILTGGTGVDAITPSATLVGAVTIDGGAGADILNGSAGDDIFLFGTETGLDVMNGGLGNDSIVARANSARLNLQSITGIEAITAGTNPATGLPYTDVQIQTANATTGTLTYDFSAVTLTGIARINAGTGNEIIIGSAGNDVIWGLAGNDDLRGGLGDDTLKGGAGNDTLDGGAGIDTYDASDITTAGTITISSTVATTHVAGTATDTLVGFENVIGGTAADTIAGSDVANRLDGAGGVDTIDGGAGDDVLVGGGGGDILKGGLGSDAASYDTQAAPSTATTDTTSGLSINGVKVDLKINSSSNGTTAPTLKATQGDAAGDWFFQVENLTGSQFGDMLTGDDFANKLAGGAGSDALYGGAGDDQLSGDGGSDYLDGQAGVNTAVFAGNIADYTIVTGPTVTTVTGINGRASDGVDTLKNIQSVKFADVTISLGVNANNAPILGAPAMEDKPTEDGKLFSYQIPATSFIDLDIGNGIDAMVLAATLADNSPLPSWLSFNPATRTFSGTVPTATVGFVTYTLDIKVTATDSGFSISDNFLLSVTQAKGADIIVTGTTPVNGTFRSENMFEITGGTADNIFNGSGGADTINGGTGLGDRVIYAASASGVTINLKNGLAASGGDAEGDVLIALERATGSAFDDNITGSDDANDLDGGAGNDVIDGGFGDDLITGGDGVDTLNGGAGNDTINAKVLANGALEDVIDGGNGVDELRLSISADTNTVGVTLDLNIEGNNPASIENVVGTVRADTITGNEFNNILSGGAGNDTLAGGTGNDTLNGGADVDSLFGQAGNDKLYGDDGNDSLSGGEGNDKLFGGFGDDVLFGGIGADDLNGGDGVDSAVYRKLESGGALTPAGITADLANSANNTGIAAGDTYDSIENLYGTSFDDILRGDAGANLLSGSEGNDTLQGAGGDDTLDGSDGNDTLFGGTGNDTLTGSLGDDSLSGEDGNDTLDGGDGVDSLFGGIGIDTLRGGAGNDSIRGGTDADILEGGADRDALFGDEGNDTLKGEGGDDWLQGGAGADSLDGGAGTDWIYYVGSIAGVSVNLASGALSGGDAAGDTIVGNSIENVLGSSLDDVIVGSSGTNSLSGDAGNDRLNGGAGADALDGGAGTDTLDYSTSTGGVTVDIYLNTASGGDAQGDAISGFENLDGSTVGDTLLGSLAANIIHGNAGDDFVYARDGNDTLYGDDGTDQLYGQEGDDLIYGGNQLDYLFGGSGIDTLFGEAGDDRLYGDAGADYLYGGDGESDTLSGGSGADRLDGGLGSYDYVYYYYLDGGAINTAGLVVDFTNTAFNTGDAVGDSYFEIEGIVGSAGNDILRGNGVVTNLYGHDGNDTITGSAVADFLSGDAGNDTLSGGDGADTLQGGDGDDNLTGGLGVDAVNGGAGDDLINALVVGEDVIDGGTGIDTVSFAAATSVIIADITNGAHRLTNIENVTGGSGNDQLSGSAGVNRLDGGLGDDIIQGGAGGDTLIGGAGTDLLIYSNSGVGANFQSGLIGQSVVNGVTVFAAVDRTLNGVDVNLAANTASGADATGDVISGFENLGGSGNADRLRGSAGNTTVYGQGGDDVIYGGAGDDWLYGGDGNDIIYGEAGVDNIYGGNNDDRLFGDGASDYLYGEAGNDLLDAGDAGDVLDGGIGDDKLIGGLGDDTYMLSRTSASDTIYNYASHTVFDNVADDVIQYAAGISRDDVWFTKVTGTRDLKIKLLGETSQVIVKDWFANTLSTGPTQYDDSGLNYVVRMVIAGQHVAPSATSIKTLLGIMAGLSEPASFGTLSQGNRDLINGAWQGNTPPTIALVGSNPTPLAEGEMRTLDVVVNDNNQTALSAISVSLQGATGPIQVQSILPVAGVGNEGLRRITYKDSGNGMINGAITLRALDGSNTPSPDLVIPVSVNIVANGVILSAPSAVGGNTNSAISLAGIIATLIDNDGSEVFDALQIEGLPAGATLSSGVNSGNTATVDVRGWNLSTLVLNPGNSSLDYSLTVRARSRETSNNVTSGDVTKAIAVTVNGAPTGVVVTPVGFDENVAGALVGALGATDPDIGNTFSYAVVGGVDQSKFTVVGTNLSLVAGQSLNFENGPASIDIRVTDQGGLTYTRTGVLITSANVNEAPNAPTSSNLNIGYAENQIGFTGVTFSGSLDPDGDVVSYVFGNGTAIDGKYEIRNTNQLWVTTALNFEVDAHGSLAVYAFANGQYSAPITQAVTIGDVNETPLITSLNYGSVDENVTGPVTLRTLNSSDPDVKPGFDAASHVFSIFAGDTNKFEIVSGNVLRTKAGVTFDYDAAPHSYALTIRVTDANGSGLVYDQAFTVHIGPVNETPHTLVDIDTANPNQLGEGQTNLSYTGAQLRATDPDGDALTYTVSGDTMNWFMIEAGTGILRIRSGVTVDYEATSNGTVSVNVTATDPSGANTSGSFTFTVVDTNETPIIAPSGSANVSESAVGGNFVATLSSTDTDKSTLPFGTSGHIYSIVGGHSMFDISGSSLIVKAGATLNFEGAPSYNFTVRVTDNYGNAGALTADQNYTVTINNVPPSAPAVMADIYVDENVNFGAGIAGSVDPGGGEVDYDFAPGGNTNGWFAIDNVAGNTGTLRLVNALNFEAIQGSLVAEGGNRGYVDVNLVGKDSSNVGGPSRSVRVHFNNVNDNAPNAPVVSSWGTTNFNENTGAGYIVAYLTAPTDPDGTLNALSYQLTSNPDGMFEIVGNEVRVITARNFDYERFVAGGASTLLSVGVRTTDGVYASGSTSLNVTVNNTDDNLPVGGGITNQGTIITENVYTPGSGAIIATANASDADGDGLVWSIVGGNPTGALGVNNSGQIFIANGFDYEALGGAANLGVDPNIGFSVTVRAAQANNSGRYIDQTLNLQIADIPEIQPLWAFLQQGTLNMSLSIGNGFYYERGSYGGGPGPGSDRTMRIVYDPSRGWATGTSVNYGPNGLPNVGTIVAVRDFNMFSGTYNEYVISGYQWSGPAWLDGSTFIKSLPPVVLDLNNDGEITSILAATFDVDGDGRKDKTGWISSGDAFLALDRDGNGAIDRGVEISFIGDKTGAKTDLEGLSAYDSNADGVFDASDARFGEFLVWQDANSDGISQVGELKSLVEAGIASINLTSTPATPSDEGGVAVLGTSTFTRADGTTGVVGDVALRWDEIVQASAATVAASTAAPTTPLPIGTSLALDADGNGLFDIATETYTLATALAAFDSNGDGRISAADARYFDLRLWADANANGRVELTEVQGLDLAGLMALAPAAAVAATMNSATLSTKSDGMVKVEAADAATTVGATTLANNATPAADATPEVTPPPALAMKSEAFDRKAKKFLIEARDGGLFVSSKKGGTVDARAGEIGAATILSFKGHRYGLLAPIILDLDGDGIDLVSAKKSRATFDMDGDGVADDTGWVGKGDALLVIDRNGDGKITGASEISFLTENADARSDLAALAALDSNRDGKIDASDTRFGELKVWVDANLNGVSEDGELKTLEQVGIKDISLAGRSTSQKVKLGKNIVVATSTFTRTDGSTGTVGDVALAFTPSSKPVSAVPADGSADTSSLAGFAGIGEQQLASLRSLFGEGSAVQQSASASQFAIEGSDADSARIAQMVQAMAVFGATGGQDSLLLRRPDAYGDLSLHALS